MQEEILVSGKLKDIVDEVERIRSAARREKGWIMDCLLLKKPREGMRLIADADYGLRPP